MEQLKILMSNYLINVGVISWFAAQVIKTILHYIDNDKLELERMVGAGGMPSAHSALVCGITVGMAKKMGFSSPEFALALAFAGVVMYDAMGVRRAAGEQAKVLNRMMGNLRDQADGFLDNITGSQHIEDGENDINNDYDSDENEKSLKEYLGHTPLEVLGGALLGILVAMIIPVV